MPTIRPSTDADLPAITAIYGHHVLHGTGTFETTPPTESEMATRRADVLAKGLPWLVIEDGGQVTVKVGSPLGFRWVARRSRTC